MDTCFIFDVDGVITNPTIKTPNKFIIQFIAQKLKKKEYVAILTGRALTWVAERILRVLQTQLEDIADLDYLFISCEKGTVTTTFVNGIIKTQVDPGYTISQEIADAIKENIAGKQGIFYDRDKQTMISVEIDGGEDEEEIEKQKAFLREFEDWANDHILSKNSELVLEKSPISVDIQFREVSKKMASQKFLKFLKDKNISAEKFIAFGDTQSDANIALAIHDGGNTVIFVYVGDKLLEGTFPFEVVSEKDKKNDSAVEEYLKRFS